MKKYPQAVYSCFTKSLLQCEWNYLQRVVPGCDDLYEELKTTINQVLIPAIFGREVLQREYELLELPVRIGGMALKDPVKTASTNFNNYISIFNPSGISTKRYLKGQN